MNNQSFIVSLTLYSVATYLGDNNKRKVHDLLNLKNNCCIDTIKTVHKRYFIPDTFAQANSEEYDSCVWCIGNYQK